MTDYTAAEKYLLSTVAKVRKALQRPSTLYAVPATGPEDDGPARNR
ncbi:hypothetical protein [Rhodococcus qingshengii]|nr:hypothetical protein [Rhodococcus qingshengii]